MKCQRHDKISTALYNAVKLDYANGRHTSEIAAWHKIGESTARFIRRANSYLDYQMAVANKRIGKISKEQAQAELERLVDGRLARPELVSGAKVAPIVVNVVLAQKCHKFDLDAFLDAISIIISMLALGALIFALVVLFALMGRVM